MAGIYNIGGIQSSGGIRKSSGIPSMLTMAGPGLLAKTMPGGKVSLTSVAGRSGKRTSHPWKLKGIVETGSVAKIFVKPGLVNNFIPVIGEVEIDALDVPLITVTGEEGTILLKATTTDGLVVTKVELINSATMPPDTETTFHKVVGTWEFETDKFTKITSILNTNQTLYFCRKQPIWE